MLKEISVGSKPYDGKPMHPDTMAQVALFLASEDSSAISGATIDALGNTIPLFG